MPETIAVDVAARSRSWGALISACSAPRARGSLRRNAAGGRRSEQACGTTHRAGVRFGTRARARPHPELAAPASPVARPPASLKLEKASGARQRAGIVESEPTAQGSGWHLFGRARARSPHRRRRARSNPFKARRRRAGLPDARRAEVGIFSHGRRRQRPKAVAAHAPPCALARQLETESGGSMTFCLCDTPIKAPPSLGLQEAHHIYQ